MNPRTIVMTTLCAGVLSTSASGLTIAQAADTMSGPSAPRTALGLDIDNQWRLDNDYRLFSTDRHTGGIGLSGSHDLMRAGPGTLALTLGIQWEFLTRNWGGADDQPAGSHSSALTVSTPTVGVLFRAPRWWFLEPYARAALGASLTEARLQMSDGQIFEGEEWSTEIQTAAGVRIRSRPLTHVGLRGRGHGVAVALSIEGGFTAGFAPSLSLHPPAPSDDKVKKDMIPIEAVEIGRLSRAHPHLRFALQVLF
jgi:hypothetical protein